MLTCVCVTAQFVILSCVCVTAQFVILSCVCVTAQFVILSCVWVTAQFVILSCVCVTAQFAAMVDELARRREECIQLRTLLATRSKGQTDIASESYGGQSDLVNEDGELEMAYKTQRDLNK